MTVALLDSSVLCEVLRIPGKCQHPDIQKEPRERIGSRESLLIPIVAVVETGNHIGRIGDGGQARRVGQKFVELLRDAMTVEPASPFTLTHVLEDRAVLTKLLDDFPDQAMRGLGVGDQTIQAEFELLVRRYPRRRVYVWTFDERHLGSLDTGPRC